MIQANELRIGNWIYSDDTKMNYQVDGHGILVASRSPENRSPIPLTLEILDKIYWGGYVKLNIGSYFKIDDVGHLFYRSDYTGVNIYNLHQLQNLYFAITGTELNISL